jgi:hypothetical protein
LEILVALWYRLAAGRSACQAQAKAQNDRSIMDVYENVLDQLELLLAQECGLNQYQHKEKARYAKP